MKRQLIVSAILVALTVVGVLNFDTVRVSAAEFPAIYISPAYVTVGGCTEMGSNFTFSICTDYNGSDVCGYEFKLTYDPTVLEGVNVTNGDLITKTKNDTASWSPGEFNNTVGTLSRTGASFLSVVPPPYVTSGPGILANVTFTVVGCGISNISLVEDAYATRLIGFDPEHPRADQDGYYNIIDKYWPDPGHIEGSVFDHSASHDVAIIDVSPNQTVVAQGFNVDISVTAQNQGQLPENFTVTAYYDTTVIQTENITNLANGTSTTLTFTWNTTGVPLGSYTIKANASIVTDETDTADNTHIDGTITVAEIDAAVTEVVPWSQWCSVPVGQGYHPWNVNISVTVENNGTTPATFAVRAYANETLLGTLIASDLPAGQNTTLVFNWLLTGLPYGYYPIKATATLVGDTNPGNDEYIDGQMLVKVTGDVDANGKVDATDVFSYVALAYNSAYGQPEYDCQCDFDGNGNVNPTDVFSYLAIWYDPTTIYPYP